MIPGEYNITMTRGCVRPLIEIQLIGGNGPFDLTGYTPAAQVRVEPGGDVILDLEPVVSDAAQGKIQTAEFTDEETMQYVAGVYHWDLTLENVENSIFGRFLTGQFYIVDKITNS